MAEINFEYLSLNTRIRYQEIDGVSYFSVIDVLAELRGTDFRTAQRYYHVVKNRMNKNGVEIPDLKQIKSKATDEKLRFSDFTTQAGIMALVDYLALNLRNEKYRIEVRNDDEEVNFHPQVINFFEANNCQVKHHVKLPSGSQVDVVATFADGNVKHIFIVECKPRLSRQYFFNATGQVLCYCVEYSDIAIPVIATYSTQIDDYTTLCFQALGIRLLSVDVLRNEDIFSF